MTDQQKYNAANILIPYLENKQNEFEKTLLGKIPHADETEMMELKYRYKALIDLINAIEQDIINQQIKDKYDERS